MLNDQEVQQISALGLAAAELGKGAAALAAQKTVIDGATPPLTKHNYSGGSIQTLVTTCGTVTGLCAGIAESARDRLKKMADAAEAAAAAAVAPPPAP